MKCIFVMEDPILNALRSINKDFDNVNNNTAPTPVIKKVRGRPRKNANITS